MAETSDSHQNRPRISVEEWLAATESEYQETARQVGESLTELRSQTTRALWLLSFTLALLGVSSVLFEVSLSSPDGWELVAVLPVLLFGVAPGFYFLFESPSFVQRRFKWGETQLGQKHIAERKLSFVRSELSLAAEAAARRFRIFSVWRWIWLFSNIWGTTLLALK